MAALAALVAQRSLSALQARSTTPEGLEAQHHQPRLALRVQGR
jgi:hypothetical protein